MFKTLLNATLSFALTCSAPSFAAGPQPIKTAAHVTVETKSAPSSAKLKVWQVTQTSSWGRSVVKACGEGIRIEANTGSVLVAKAPNWDVVIFRPGQKKASKNSFAKFITKYPHNDHAEKYRGLRRNAKILGAPAVQYVMPINRRLDASDGFGMTFQSKLETPYVSNMVMSLAADSRNLPPKAKEIWRTYFEFSFIEKIPLEYYCELGDGNKRYIFQTIAQKDNTVPAAEFDHPKGLEYTAEFMQMIYGQKMEDVADLLMSP